MKLISVQIIPVENTTVIFGSLNEPDGLQITKIDFERVMIGWRVATYKDTDEELSVCVDPVLVDGTVPSYRSGHIGYRNEKRCFDIEGHLMEVNV